MQLPEYTHTLIFISYCQKYIFIHKNAHRVKCRGCLGERMFYSVCRAMVMVTMPDCVSNSVSISKLHSCEPAGNEQHCCRDLHKLSACSLACSLIHYININAQIMADRQMFLSRVV